MLTELTELARHNSDKSRGELLLALADLFLAAERSEAIESSGLFSDTMRRILGHVGLDDRRGLSEKMAGAELTPHDLALTLADDVIDVAAPILTQSEALKSGDLARIASTRAIEYQIAIAARRKLDVAVTDVLVQRGNIEVAHAVTGNEGAEFSKEALNLLVARARKDTVLQSNLASRPDLPKDVARNLMPFLSKELREKLGKLLERGGQAAATEVTANGVRCIEEGRSATEAAIEDIRHGRDSVDGVIDRLAAQESTTEIIFVLSQMTGVAEKNVEKSLTLKEAMPIMMICKVAGLTPQGFTRIAEYRSFELDQSMAAAQASIRQYRAIPREQAEKTVRSLKN